MNFSLLLHSPPTPPSTFLLPRDRYSAPPSSLIYYSCRCSNGRFVLPLRRRRKSSTRLLAVRSSSVSSSPSSSEKDGKHQDEWRVGSDLGTLSRRFWKVAAPYWSSDDKVQARLRLAAVFALTLGTTGISVGFNFLGRDFYNALANKDQEQFTKQLLYYLGGFAGGIPFFVLRDYAKDTLSLRWRSWMTSYYMDRYLKNQTFYKIQSQSIIDNPDQRIVDDLSAFTATALSFSLTIFNAFVDLISFSNILFGIYPPLFVVLLVYSLGGTAISVFLGKDLVTLNFMQEKKEADFRYGLVRVRENAESIAFYGGEENELLLLLERFERAFDNLSKLLISSRNLDFFTSGYRYLIQVLPAAVVAPMYFTGKIEFGVINQSVSAFNHILGDFSLIIYQFQALSAFSAVIDRLGEFDDILDGISLNNSTSGTYEKITIQNNKQELPSLQSNGSVSVDGCQKLLIIKNLKLQTPNANSILIEDLNLEIIAKDHLLVMGPSGCGKTSLLRALAGLWRSGEGNVSYYTEETILSQSSIPSDVTLEDMNSQRVLDAKNLKSKRLRGVFFLPQKPYMVLGSLRQQLLYPTWRDNPLQYSNSNGQDSSLHFMSQITTLETEQLRKPSSDDIIHALEVVRLGDILSRFGGLDSVHEWSSVLSLGEQQRLAFARLLLSKPKLALLDESTSALDNANEAHLYQQIEAAGVTYVSVGHRTTLYNYHNRVLLVSKLDHENPSKRNWRLEYISRVATNEEPKPSFDCENPR